MWADVRHLMRERRDDGLHVVSTIKANSFLFVVLVSVAVVTLVMARGVNIATDFSFALPFLGIGLIMFLAALRRLLPRRLSLIFDPGARSIKLEERFLETITWKRRDFAFDSVGAILIQEYENDTAPSSYMPFIELKDGKRAAMAAARGKRVDFEGPLNQICSEFGFRGPEVRKARFWDGLFG